MILVLNIRVINYTGYLAEISRDAVTPPELSANAPILDLLKPVEPSALAFLWQDLKISRSHSITRAAGELFAICIPLGLKEGFNDVV
jgi:hypothetical protein